MTERYLASKKWEYRLLVELWDRQRQCFYWADNDRDPRTASQRLDALEQEGWEVVSSFPCRDQVTQRNYLLKRFVEGNVN